MREELHEGGRILLDTESKQWCACTGERFDSEAHRVRLKLSADSFDRLHDHGISIGAVDSLVSALSNEQALDGKFAWCEADDCKPGSEGWHCLVCGDGDYSEDVQHLAIQTAYNVPRRRIYPHGYVFIVHRECVEEFCEALDRVWEYSDELVSEFV